MPSVEQRRSSVTRLSAFVFLAIGGVFMDRHQEKTTAGRIFENILFLEEVFGDKPDADIPDVPVLELAKCFELSQPKIVRASRGRHNDWPLWK